MVAQRLADAAIESDKKLAALQAERDSIRAAKEDLAKESETSRESHKAQSGIFSRELKAAMKQRDDAVASAEAERAAYAEKSAAVTAERAALVKTEAELNARFERESARLRRERDSVIQQRDALRERIQTLIDQQHHILDEVSAQATQTEFQHRETPKNGEPAPRPTAPPKPRETARDRVRAAAKSAGGHGGRGGKAGQRGAAGCGSERGDGRQKSAPCPRAKAEGKQCHRHWRSRTHSSRRPRKTMAGLGFPAFVPYPFHRLRFASFESAEAFLFGREGRRPPPMDLGHSRLLRLQLWPPRSWRSPASAG